jgi:hypothetical protein
LLNEAVVDPACNTWMVVCAFSWLVFATIALQ